VQPMGGGAVVVVAKGVSSEAREMSAVALRGRAYADIMEPRTARWTTLPGQHQDGLGGASVSRRASDCAAQ
jgi:hypothetical protein